MRVPLSTGDVRGWGQSVPNREPVQAVITVLILSTLPGPATDLQPFWRRLLFNLKTGWFLDKLFDFSRCLDQHEGLYRVIGGLLNVVASEDMQSRWTGSFLPLLETEVSISKLAAWRLSMPSNSPLRHLAACSQELLSHGRPEEIEHRWALLQHFIDNLAQSAEDLRSFSRECLLRGGSL